MHRIICDIYLPKMYGSSDICNLMKIIEEHRLVGQWASTLTTLLSKQSMQGM